MDPAQIELMEQMRRLLAENAANTRDMTIAMGEQLQILREIKEAGGIAAGSMRDAGNATNDFAAAADAAATAASGAFDTMSRGLSITDMLSNSWELLKTNVSSLFTAITTPMTSILGFLGTAYEGALEMANKLIESMYNLRDAFEKVREAFGSFAENTSGRVKRALGDFDGQLRDSADGAYYFGSKFAPGIEGTIERLELMKEYAGDLGAVFDVLGEDFSQATAQTYMLNKSLGFSGEQLKKVGVLSRMSSLSLKDFSQGILNNVNKIGRSLGISTKLLGKDVAAAITNFQVLGKTTGDYVKQTIISAAFTRKLGIELNELANLAGKFDDFEQGAEAAAQLAQGFGLVIDPLKMMREQDPAKRLDEMRKAFAATGRSIEAMSRAERKLLADSAGLDEQQAMLAFSSKGMGLSYDQVSGKADAAAKQQKSQQQIISELADNIENVIVRMEPFMGFLDAFMKGFMRGFGTSLMPIITDLAIALGEVFHIGVDVGRMIGSIFMNSEMGDGISGFIKLISDFSKGFSNLAKIFAGDLTAGKTLGQAIEHFILGEDGKGGLMNLLSGSGSTLSGIISTMLSVIGKIFTEVFKALPSIIKSLVPMIKTGLQSMIDAMKSAFQPGPKTSGSILGELLTAIIDVFNTLKDQLPTLMPLIVEFGDALMDMLIRMFKEYPIATALGGLFVAGGPIFSMVSGFAGNLIEFIKNIFTGGSAVPAELSNTASDVRAATESVGSPGTGGGTGTGVAGALTALAERSRGMMEGLGTIVKAMGSAATYAAIAYGIKTISAAVKDAIESFIKPGEDGKSFIDYIGEAANKLSGVSVTGLLVLGGTLGAIMLAVGGIIAAIGFAISKMPASAVGVVLAGAGALAAIKSFLPGGKKEEGETEGTSTIKSLLTSMRALIIGIVDIMGGNDFKTAINSAAAVGSSMAGKIGSITALSQVVESLGKAVVSIGNAMKSFDAFGDGKMGDRIGRVKAVVSHFVDLFRYSVSSSGQLHGIQSYLQIIPNFDATGLEAKANALGSISKVISAISDIAKNIGGTNITSESITKMKFAMASAMQLFSAVGTKDGTQKSIQDILRGVPNVDAASMQQKVDSMLSMTSVIEKVSELVQKLSGMTVGDQRRAARSMKALGEEGGPIAELSWLFQDAAINPNGMGALSLLAYESVGSNLSFDGVFDPLDSYLDRAESISERLAGYKLDQFTDRLKAVTGHITSIREIMENLDTIPLDATLDAMSENMNVAKTTMSVNGGAVVVKVAMTVNMNAQKMSEELVMSGYIAPTEQFEKFLTTTDGVDDFFSTEKFIESNKSLVRSSRSAETGEFRK